MKQDYSDYMQFPISKSEFAANVTIIFVGLLFGIWFATNQIHAVTEVLAATYPAQYFCLTVFKCTLTIITIYYLTRLLLTSLLEYKNSNLLTALAFLPLLLINLGYPLYWLVASITFLLTLSLIANLKLSDYRRLASNYLPDVLVLMMLILLHTLLTTRFSPLNWHNAILVAEGYNSEEIPVLAPLFKSFILAKFFSFSNVDHAQWAGIMNPPAGLNSPFMQLLAFIFDLPSISYASYHSLLMAIYFILVIIGSYGFYLYLKYAMRLIFPFAFLGSCLYFFSGSPILADTFTADGGIFLSSYAVFPYALLIITLAFEKSSFLLAAWAGLALATQFFLSTPHPEGVIYSLLFFAIYTGGLVLFSSTFSFSKRVLLGGVALLSFLLLSAFIIAPIMVDRITGNMYVFAHIGDITRINLRPFTAYFALFAFFTPVSIYLLRQQKRLIPAFKSILLLSTFLLCLILSARSLWFIESLVQIFHIGLHFWVVSRIGMYFCLSVFVISLAGLEAISFALSKRIRNEA